MNDQTSDPGGEEEGGPAGQSERQSERQTERRAEAERAPERDRGARSWLPRGAALFLLIAALLVGTVAVARPSWFGGAAEDDVPPDRRFDTSLLDLGFEDGIRLSDDTGTSQAVTLPVPVDSKLEDPVLRLRGSTEVAASGTVFLRVLVDGEAAYVSELPVGRHDLDADVELPPSSVEDGEVKVQVRMSGNLDQRRCNLTTDLGSLVVLDPERTRVAAALDERVHTVRDVIAGLDRQVTLVLAADEVSEEWFETAARLAAFLTQQGHVVDYTHDVPENARSSVLLGTPEQLDGLGWKPLSGDGSVQVGRHGGQSVLGVVQPARNVVPTFLTTSPEHTTDTGSTTPSTVELERPRGDRARLESLGLDTTVQQITDRRAWRVPYSLSDLPGGTVPTSLRLGMLVPATTDDARWLVQVRLNDQLVDSIRLPGVGRQSVTADLPAGGELVRNELVVSLVRDRDLGGCHVRQTTYDVQLLPGSTLVLGGTGTGFTAVPAQFSRGFDVLVPRTDLDEPTTALDGLVPTLAEFSGWRQEAAVAWDGVPSGRPFLLVGDPSPGLSPLVRIVDGEITSAGFAIETFADGLVVQCVRAGATSGMVLTPVGDPGTQVPDYGRERARVVTDGGGFVVSPNGRVVSLPTARAESDG